MIVSNRSATRSRARGSLVRTQGVPRERVLGRRLVDSRPPPRRRVRSASYSPVDRAMARFATGTRDRRARAAGRAHRGRRLGGGKCNGPASHEDTGLASYKIVAPGTDRLQHTRKLDIHRLPIRRLRLIAPNWTIGEISGAIKSSWRREVETIERRRHR